MGPKLFRFENWLLMSKGFQVIVSGGCRLQYVVQSHVGQNIQEASNVEK